MANITKVEAVPTKREFIGRAWINTVAKEGALKGTQFMNVQIDNGIKEITLKPTDRLQLWPNQQRSGKRDADYRLSIVSEESAQGVAQTALV
jgi:uncharacterized protein (DUF736 family)